MSRTVNSSAKQANLVSFLPRWQVSLILLACLLLSLGQPISAQAQAPTFRFEHISLEQGLSHGTVFSIVQDHTGFMWFGTPSGLNKYDGYTITIFKSDPQNPNSLSNDNAGNLYIDRAGIIWIGTWGGGLARLDPQTEQFSAYLNDPTNPASLSSDRVQTIFEDRAGMLWVGTAGGGLNKFDRATERFTVYKNNPANPHSLSNDRIWSIAEDKAGHLWVATSEGLNKFDPQTETFTRYLNNPADPASLSNNLVRTLYVDKSGTLWLGNEAGLDKFDPPTDSFIHYQNNPADPTSLSDTIVNAILEDSAGNFWVGTRSGGLNLFDRSRGTFTRYLNDPRDSTSLSYDDIRSIYEDHSGVLWLATRGGGVNKFTPTSGQFMHVANDPDNPHSLNNNDVRAIYEDPAKNLWIGTKGGGLNKFDPQTGRFVSFQNDPNNADSLSNNDVYAVYQDQAGNLWLGTSGAGLNKFDPQSQTFTRYQNNPDDPTSLSFNDVNTIYEDHAGTLWIGTKGGGLNKFDAQMGQFTRYQNNPADPTSLGGNDVYALLEDSQGVFWVCTYGGGLNRFDRTTGQFIRYIYDPNNPTSLSSNDVYTIYEDQAGTLWVGLANGGLNKFERETGQFIRYGPTEGLASNVVYGILGDAQGNLWLSTSKGLSKFNLRSQTFVNYDAGDGLSSGVFNEGAYYQSRSGEMFFGSINGLVRFDPAAIKDNPHPPSVVLTAFSILNRQITLDQPVERLKEVKLSYRDIVFSFEFAALDYTHPAKNQYAYKLEGFDQDWINAGTRRFGTYTNLDAGDYTLRIKASNNSGVWNEEGVSLHIVVTPPFWETWWFRLMAVAAVLALGFTAYTVRVAGIQAQRKKLQTQVAERTAELSQANEHLRTLTDRLQQELTAAQEIQKSLLPPSRPDWLGLHVICYSISAREVGGDFYAYHSFGQDKTSSFAIALGDVSGKGMPAALLMAVSFASFQSVIDQALTPAKLLAHLDAELVPYTRTRFRQNCALCYMEITRAGHSDNGTILRAANAGCVAPLIRRAAGSLEWVDIGGPPLGIGLSAQDDYIESLLALQPGDLVILTSDGVVEAMNARREIFGFERLEQTVAAGPQTSAEAMLDHLRTTVLAFTAETELHDDLTIVVVQV